MSPLSLSADTMSADESTNAPEDSAAKDAPQVVVTQNSNRQSNILMIGTALVVFLTVIVVALLLRGRSASDETSSPTALLALLDEADESISTARTQVAGIENARFAAEAQLDTALREIDSLQKTTTAFGEQAGRAAMLQTELDSAKATITSLEGRLENSRLLMDSVRTELAALQEAKTELEKIRAMIADKDRSIASLTEQRDLLRQRLEGAVSGADASAMRADLARTNAENESLKLELQKLRAELDRSRLYVEDAANLSPIAAALFTELQGLEGSTPESLRLAYERIEKDINARRIDLLAFQTGSAAVDTGRVSRITRDIAASNEKSFFLVVGYASESGDSADNRTLSARRATAVASIVDSLKRPGNTVQAVYLGETDRFSPDSLPRNQVCEIWEIKPSQLER